MPYLLRNYKQRIKKWLPFDIWDYIPESIRRLYAGSPLLISREIRELKRKLLSANSTWDDLIKYSNIAGYDNNHQFYQTALKSYDSSIEFKNIEGVAFVGDGFGLGSLNSYRKVYYRNESKSVTCFEKVYVQQSTDFKKVCWFYSSIYDQLKHDLKIPNLHTINGHRLGVAYFDWVDHKKLADDEFIPTFLSITSHLKKIRLDNQVHNNQFFSNYLNDSNFKIYFERAKLWLIENRDHEHADILSEINNDILKDGSLKRQFVHGNISKTNLLLPDILIDFDTCGYYPFEYEIGSFLTGVFTFKTLDQFYNKLLVIQDTYPDNMDERLILYFSFIFNMRIKHSEGDGYIRQRDHFLNELWSKLIKISK